MAPPQVTPEFNNLRVMNIEIQFLRALEQNVNFAGVDLLLQVQADAFGVANNLGRVLIE